MQNYFVVDGRARRKEYWMFFLFAIIFAVVAGVADVFMGTFDAESGWGVLGAVYSLGILIPSITVGVRRLHDTDRSGWWMLIGLIPLIGGIVLLIFFCLRGTEGSNRFGPDPLTELLTPALQAT
jgi:uncharacterized membrane protein YhaH (DUF805 family)